MTHNKIWFITGASRGFGRVWAQAALERGDKVAATARDISDLSDLAARYGNALLPLRLDVNDRAEVFRAVDSACAHFGRLDVVISNAGYALFGTVEECTEEQSRAQFNTNFFGTLWVMQAALPRLRAQGAGHLLPVTSLAGIITYPTTGLYCASKWAVEGLMEALAQEVADLGVKVTLIEPGSYATDWRGNSATHSDRLAAYGELRNKLAPLYANRPLGDPATTADAILRVVDAEIPPLRLFLGAGPLDIARRQYSDRLQTWEAWADVSRGAQG
jgi:NAD(P)-dependent dehydrogenase (short-subunit alcohol dehydrogenase family)